MKITKTVLLAFLITLINVSSVLADGTPPAPTSTNRSSAIPPPPVDGPINDYLIVLLICGLSFGIHTIYRYNLNKKASI
jgi:hypothetical protein